MRYIIIILFGLSLPVAALGQDVSQDKSGQTKTFQQKMSPKIKRGDYKLRELQRKIQKQIKREGICDPEEKLHLPPFN